MATSSVFVFETSALFECVNVGRITRSFRVKSADSAQTDDDDTDKTPRERVSVSVTTRHVTSRVIAFDKQQQDMRQTY